MAETDLLNIWHEQKLVGQIHTDVAGNMGFKYDQSWLDTGFAISQKLPLRQTEYSSTDGIAHQFFANLLPEAGARTHIVRDLKIANNDFALLKSIGGECAGALSILPINHPAQAAATYKKLTSEELSKILLRKRNILSLADIDHRPRLSLAGAQDKFAVLYKDGNYLLPQDSAPSSHIIKFELLDYRNIPAYECLLLKLSKAIGLPTVNCELKQHNGEYFLLVERYDRILAEEKILRLHQEDLCQALGVTYANKYQQNGGPSFQECYKLIQEVSTQPIIDAENLLKWQIFNYLTGNSDGHAKNIALLYNQDQNVSMAPFYDLVCTRAVERIDSNLALAIGDEFNPDKINKNHWLDLARTCNIKASYLINLIKELCQNIEGNLDQTIVSFEQQYGPYPALQRVRIVINKQCKRCMQVLNND